MSDSNLQALEARLAALERRVGALEGLRVAAAPAAPALATAATAAPSPSATGVGTLPLVGRSLLVMAGAFLLRALTSAGSLEPRLGVLIGFVYAMLLLGLAGRAARGGHPKSALFHAAVSALIVFPLLVESTIQQAWLPRSVAIVLLPVAYLAGVSVAYRRSLRWVAWIFCVAGGTTGLALAVGSGFWPPFTFAVLAMTLGGLWLGYLRGWAGLAVVGSAVADSLVFVMPVLLLLKPEGLPMAELSPRPLLLLQLSLITLYLASFLLRALRYDKHISMPEVLQALTAFAIGIGGALVLTRLDPWVGRVLGPFTAVMGALCYGVAFSFVDRREGRRRNFAFFSTSALVASVVAVALLLDGLPLTGSYALLALAMMGLGARYRRGTLGLHSAAYLVGGAMASGAFALTLDALAGAPAARPAAGVTSSILGVVLVAAACAWTRVSREGATWGRMTWVANAVAILVFAVGLAGLGLVEASALARRAEGGYDAGVLASVRTGGVALAAIALGLLARPVRFAEARRVVPVFLVIGALLLLIGDLRLGRPATQAVSMVLYGAAVLIAPRLARRPGPPSAGAAV